MTALDLPPIYLLSTHLQPDELHAIEEKISSLTWDIHEAEIVLGRISKKERALFELRRLKLKTQELSEKEKDEACSRDVLAKGRKTGKESGTASTAAQDTVRVLKLSWLEDSLQKGSAMPFEDYLLYSGKKISTDSELLVVPMNAQTSSSILKRAAMDSIDNPPPKHPTRHARLKSHTPALLHQTTSENNISLPPVPDFLHTSYSCQRPTPVNPPNADFIEALKEVRTLRLLEGDQVGVRAYSTGVAALAAYPHAVQSPAEVSRLPGCGDKFAELFQQWKDLGRLEEAAEAASNERLSVLKLFYDIWGVGDITARDFYNRGWRDLDDVITHYWSRLTRVQQIGVKFYDDFLLKIPRSEVASIGAIILSHARIIHSNFQMVIVGGYRRGKTHSGDVDVVLSHPNEKFTDRFIGKLVISLEKSRHITHTLSLSTRNSERGQVALPWKGEGRKGGGFDTLDKAMVVWKEPDPDPDVESTAPHRRVDIIISPWKTAGCAVFGWSGGTTFQRDLRRYCKKEKGLKFDSSGVRNRTDGSWVDIERNEEKMDEKIPSMEAKEKMVFEGLGLEYRRPEERCTG